MREILFRGKRVDNGEWVEGDYLRVRARWHEHGIHEDWIVCSAGQNIGMIALYKKHPVLPDTVGQYTGLTDRNGKKIFEGDIIRSEFTRKLYPVCFGEYYYVDEYENEQIACGWYNKEVGGYETAFGDPDGWASVVSNIHDNPELLEVSK